MSWTATCTSSAAVSPRGTCSGRARSTRQPSPSRRVGQVHSAVPGRVCTTGSPSPWPRAIGRDAAAVRACLEATGRALDDLRRPRRRAALAEAGLAARALLPQLGPALVERDPQLRQPLAVARSPLRRPRGPERACSSAPSCSIVPWICASSIGPLRRRLHDHLPGSAPAAARALRDGRTEGRGGLVEPVADGVDQLAVRRIAAQLPEHDPAELACRDVLGLGC